MYVNPDYNITPTATYRRACHTWLDALDKLSFLEFCDMPKGGGNGPSWVPDWSKGLPREPITFGRFASGQSCTGGARIIDDSILEVVGVECGVISWAEDLTKREDQGTWEYWRSVLKEVSRFDEKADGSSDAQLDAFVATLCGNRVREIYPSHIYWPTVSQCKRAFTSADGRALRMNEKGFDGFHNSVQDFTQGRRFFKSQEYMGFGAQSIADGDIITVLLGFDAPVILRPKASELHMIVGEAYAHGLMSGEAILRPLPSGWLAQAARSQQGAMFQKFTKGPDGAVLYDPRLGPLWEVFWMA